MPRSCPPLRSDEVGWHGRRVSTRLRLILERVFWFVNGGMSRVGVGVEGDGKGSWLCGMMEVTRGYALRPWVPAFAGKTERGVGDDGGWVRFHALLLGPGLRRGDGVARSGLRRGPRSGSGMTDVWGPNPWVAAFTGTTMRGAPSLHQGEALAGFLSAGA